MKSAERMYLKNEKQTFITDIVQKHPSLLINSGVTNTKIELVPKIPVKSVNWFFRKTLFENESIPRGPGLHNSTDNNKYYFQIGIIYLHKVRIQLLMNFIILPCRVLKFL